MDIVVSGLIALGRALVSLLFWANDVSGVRSLFRKPEDGPEEKC
ncbi:hypothetical protein GCM10020229_54620 [Kitasatospora albolonga]